MKKEFALYEDYEEKLHIVDRYNRIILSDNFAYDDGKNEKERKNNSIVRMEKLTNALNKGILWKKQVFNKYKLMVRKPLSINKEWLKWMI